MALGIAGWAANDSGRLPKSIGRVCRLIVSAAPLTLAGASVIGPGVGGGNSTDSLTPPQPTPPCLSQATIFLAGKALILVDTSRYGARGAMPYL